MRRGIGDDDALRALFERLRQLAQLVFAGLALGFAREVLEREADVGGHFDEQPARVVVKRVLFARVEHEDADGNAVPDQRQRGRRRPAGAHGLVAPGFGKRVVHEVLDPDRLPSPHRFAGGAVAERDLRAG